MGDRDDEEAADEHPASDGEECEDRDDHPADDGREGGDAPSDHEAADAAAKDETEDADAEGEEADGETTEEAAEAEDDEDLTLSRESDFDGDLREDVPYGPEPSPEREEAFDTAPREDAPYGPEPPPEYDDRAPVERENKPDLPEELQDFDDEGTVGEEGAAVGEGAPADEEMPLTAHVEEMLRRGAVVVFVIVIAAAAVFPLGEEVINFLWANALPQTDTRPHIYQPLELLITQIKVASLGGVIVALPVLVYESYLFMRPGLYPHERRYYLAAVPTSLVLAFVGLTFGYFVLLPAIFTYFYSYSQDVADIAFALGRTFDLILVLLGYLAVVFQLPLFIMLAMMMGIVTRQWLAERRLLFWFSFLGLSFFVSPDPTGMAPIILTVTMVVLFEGTLFLAKWTDRGREAVRT